MSSIRVRTVITCALAVVLGAPAFAEQVVYLNFGEIGATQTKSDQNICDADGGTLITMKKGPREGFAPMDIGYPNNDNRAAIIAQIVAQVTGDYGDRNIEFTTTEPTMGTWTTINVIKGGFPNYNYMRTTVNWTVDVTTMRATISTAGPLQGYYVDLGDAQGKLHRPDGTLAMVPDDMGVNQPVCLPGVAKLPNMQGTFGIAQEIDKGNKNKNKQAWVFVGAHTLGTGDDAADKNRRELAASISHELAHLLGLEHSDGEKGSILGDLNLSNYGDDKDFTDGTTDPKKNAGKKLDGILPAKDPATPRTRTSKLGDTDQHGTSNPPPPVGDPDADAALEAKKLRRAIQPHLVDSPYPVQMFDIFPDFSDPPGLDLPLFHGDVAGFQLPLDIPGPLLPDFGEAWIEIQIANLADVPPLPSDCCFNNGTPGCDTETCELIVCGFEPFCCDVVWDDKCASIAASQCGTCRGGDFRVFVDGFELVGAFDGVDQRDVFPPLPGFTNSERLTLFLDDFLAPPELLIVLDDAVVDLVVEVAGASNFVSIDNIHLIVTDGVAPPCPGDTNGDNVVDIDDIVNVVLDFGGVGDANGDGFNGDVDGNPGVDIDDIVFVVLNFGNTC